MIVLDTHIWLWWVSNPELLSNKAARAIEKGISEKAIYISSISAWEIVRLPPFLNHERAILKWNLLFLFTAIDKVNRHSC